MGYLTHGIVVQINFCSVSIIITVVGSNMSFCYIYMYISDSDSVLILGFCSGGWKYMYQMSKVSCG